MHRTGNRITDEAGRTLILRGVNLGGSSKIPSFAGQNAGSAEEVSFIGRPFPLEEAEDHFERLKKSGFTFVRLIITWEALEHRGPGIYDESYIDYLGELIKTAASIGISIYIDPHQDVWSRFTGGDGAPRWTLEKLGIDPAMLSQTGSALHSRGPGKKAFSWPVNYSLYGTATMFTLFFAGNVFAPGVKIDNESAQDYLQKSYIDAFRHCIRQLHKNRTPAFETALAGCGVMNEPHPGYIGYNDLRRLENATLALGPVPSPFEAMIAASGQPVKVPVYTPWIKGWRINGSEVINPQGLSLFKDGYTCPWKQAGVWTGEGGKTELLKPDHFSVYLGRPVSFTEDFLKPFIIRFIKSINKEDRPKIFFIEGIPHGESPSWGSEDPQNVVNAFHHYDGFTLFTKSFRSYLTVDSKSGRIILGKKKNAAFYSAKLTAAKNWTKEQMGDMPCLLGEFGLPFDMNHKKAYRTGDYSKQEQALNLYYNCIDENLLSSTLWNYTSDNTHEDGDHWNGEDFSIVTSAKASGKERREIIERAERGWLRPYPMATAGIPIKFSWDRKNLAFYFLFLSDPEIKAPTEIFIPSRLFGENPYFAVKTLEKELKLRTVYGREEQKFFIYNDGYSGKIEVSLSSA